MASLFPPDTHVFVALVALLQKYGLDARRPIISCCKHIRAAKPIYWVIASEDATPRVAQALSDFFERPMLVSHGRWELSLTDVEQIVKWRAMYADFQRSGDVIRLLPRGLSRRGRS